jgi:protein MpaA
MYKDKCIIIVPLVNPDGFLANPPSRTNSHGIDINRNFTTKDWKKDALKKWETKEHSNKRYFPGKNPGTEQETLFQMALIKRFKPHKILTLHSPLGFYDFDGPSTDIDNFEKWLEKISKETYYPLKKIGFYPGSLGNYAGFERNIFTLTLELSSSESRKGDEFYNKFSLAIVKFLSLNISGRFPFTITN